MYKILLAEDEPPILRMIKSSIEKNCPDFCVAKTCFDGEQAINALKEESFDVVITDIKMPIMTGLELAQWISINKPETIVVFLSGYQSFQYAQKALQYRAFDYILKPVSRAKLSELMDRVRKQLEKSKAPAKTETDNEKSILAILMCAGAYLMYGSNVLLPAERFWTDSFIAEVMHNSLLADESYMFFNANNQSERLLVIENSTAERTREIVNKLYSSFCSHPIPVTLLYTTGVKFGNVNSAFAAMREQLIHSLILGKSQLICCDTPNEAYENIGSPYGKEEITEIVLAIRSGKSHFMHELLSRIFQRMGSQNCTQEEFSALLNVIADTYSLDYRNELARKTVSVKKELSVAIAGFVDYDSFTNDVASILMTMRDNSEANDKYKQLADSIEAYIKENYATGITNEVLSKKFGFVPSYLSRIFKQSKGLSTSEYLLKYRIETAKKLILDCPDKMIKEIADSVGFKEAYYFSKTFKRETGVWPTEYAKAHSEKLNESKT